MTYQIYFPFKLLEDREIKDIPAEGTVGQHRAKLEFNSPYYALGVFGIASIELAQEIFHQLVGAFYWMATEPGLSHETMQELQQAYEASDPVQAAKKFGAN